MSLVKYSVKSMYSLYYHQWKIVFTKFLRILNLTHYFHDFNFTLFANRLFAWDFTNTNGMTYQRKCLWTRFSTPFQFSFTWFCPFKYTFIEKGNKKETLNNSIKLDLIKALTLTTLATNTSLTWSSIISLFYLCFLGTIL